MKGRDIPCEYDAANLFHEFQRDPTGINSLSEGFGVSFNEDFIRDLTNNEGEVFWPTIHLLANHPITQGVSSYGYYAGCCLEVSAPAVVIGEGDEDASSAFCASFPPTLAVYEASGRIVFSGDITPLHPNYYPEHLRPEEELLLQNIANWLLGPPPTGVPTYSPASWGSIKALHASE